VLKIHPSVTLHAVANACRPRLQLNIWFIHIRRGSRRVGKHLGRIKGLGYYRLPVWPMLMNSLPSMGRYLVQPN
jgi:hypothetical protein